MKTYGLPEREYYKLYKAVRKIEAQVVKKDLINKPVLLKRAVKKVVSLVKRAVVLENQMRVPAKRRWSNAYR